MRRLGLALVVMWAAGFLSAQSSSIPEIRGTVLEVGADGLAGVEVVLTEFIPDGDDLQPRVFGTVFTDARGAFSFRPGHLGDFRINIKKAGYTGDSDESTRGLYLVLKAGQPTPQPFVFRLLRPASLSGRVVDEDGKPISGFPVAIVAPTDFMRVGMDNLRVVTDPEGNFTATGVTPGPNLVSIAPKTGTRVVASDFSEEEFKIVDHEVAISYWPGDVSDPAAALPMTIAPGQQASIGTITLRKVDYYRVHVSVSNGCVSGEPWSYALFHPGERDVAAHFDSTPCRRDFILRNVERGSYTLAVHNQKDGEEMQWAISPVDVNGRNVQVDLAMLPGTEVAGRLVAPEGVALPSLKGTTIVLEPDTMGLRVANTYFQPDADGKFVTGRLPWARYRVSLVGLRPTHYVKEIRYNRNPVIDGIVTLSAGAPLEFVLDDHPAELSGTIMDGDKPVADATVILRRWPIASERLDELSLAGYTARSDDQGRFRLGGLAPGEYQIETLAPDPYISLARSHPMPSGDRIKLERDDRQSVQVKLVRPAR